MHHHRSNGFSVSGKCVTHKWKQRGGVRWYSMVRPRRKMKLLNDTIVTWVLKWQKHKIYLWTCYSWSTSIFFFYFSQFKGSSFSIAPEQEREYGIFWMYWALIWMIAPNKVGVCWFGGRGGGEGLGEAEVEKAPINSPKQMELYLLSGNRSVSVNLRS